MLVSASIIEKSMGTKLLFRDVSFLLAEGAKVGLIGRNGTGKSTLFRMLTGQDTDFTGTVERKRGIRIVVTAQEQFHVQNLTPAEYLLRHVPDYHRLKERGAAGVYRPQLLWHRG